METTISVRGGQARLGGYVYLWHFVDGDGPLRLICADLRGVSIGPSGAAELSVRYKIDKNDKEYVEKTIEVRRAFAASGPAIEAMEDEIRMRYVRDLEACWKAAGVYGYPSRFEALGLNHDGKSLAIVEKSVRA